MEPLQPTSQADLRKDLLEMQFPENLIHQALQFTSDKQKAIDYIVEAIEDMERFKINPTQPGDKECQEGEDSGDYEDADQEPTKMVFLVRMDLKMGLGKIAAQVGHATIGAYKQIEELSKKNEEIEVLLFDWMENGSKKIALKVETEEEILELVAKAKSKKVNYHLVHDAGKTQIAAGSLTVCAFGPERDQVLNSITGHLKLL